MAMSPRSRSARAVCLLTCVGMLAGGCTKTRVNLFAQYHPGAPTTIDRTPDRGAYKIKYTAADGEDLKTLRGSKRALGAGQAIGFERGPAGEVIAVAGSERFPTRLPPDARFVVWYSKKKEPTQFARTMDHVGEAAVPVLIGVGVAGLAVGALALEAAADDDDCSDGARHH
jgi:hypothetical protein